MLYYLLTLPMELLYADDLVLMAEMEKLLKIFVPTYLPKFTKDRSHKQK